MKFNDNFQLTPRNGEEEIKISLQMSFDSENYFNNSSNIILARNFTNEIQQTMNYNLNFVLVLYSF